jgi:hypothetical protein
MSRIVWRFMTGCFVLAAVLATSSSSNAAVVFSDSFESPALASGDYTGSGHTAGITGWSASPSLTSSDPEGVYRPPNTAITPIDGNQVLYLANGAKAISQVLSTNLANNTVYTFDIDVGQRLDSFPFAGYSITLLAGSTVIGSASITSAADSNIPAAGSWKQVEFSYTSLASDPLNGQALKIVLDDGGFGNQTEFDALSLSATPRTQVTPEPASLLIWSLLGLSASAIAKTRRRDK